jgi:CRP/FNR family transcriptional regulator, cyclic AMP receptor protein
MATLDVAHVPVLAVLKEKDRAKVLEAARQRTWGPGEVVVREGDSSLNLFIVLAGCARVDLDGRGPVGEIRAGDFFGEIGLVEQHARMATVVAQEELTCLLLPAWEFRALIREHPEMAIPMLETLIRRAHDQRPHEH